MLLNAASTAGRVLLALAVMTSLAATSRPAMADEDVSAAVDDVAAEVERLAEEGAVFVESGEFAQAVARYLEAYRLAQASALLYNIAFIYDRKLSEHQLAIEHYRRYLSAEDAEPQIAARALKRVRVLMAEEEAARAAQPVVVPVKKAEGATGMEIAGYVSGGVGLAALGIGVAFGVQALDTHDRFKTAQSTTRTELANTGRGQAVMADVFLGLGTASVVTGLLLILLAPQGDESQDVSWQPMGQVGPDGASFGVGGRW